VTKTLYEFLLVNSYISQNFATVFGARKLELMVLLGGREKRDEMISSFNTVHQCDEQTDWTELP